MKKNNRKGFTIVELVIVIAVIAILAAVLIPTFSNMVEKANNSADMQEARNTFTEYLAEVDAKPADVVYVKGGEQYFVFNKGQIDKDNPVKAADVPTTAGTITVTMDGEDVVINTICADGTHKDLLPGPADNKCDNCGVDMPG